MNVHEILLRIARGEQRAFAELVELYQRPLFGFLGRMGITQAQAEDIAQETFLRAWQHLPSFDPSRAQFATWLFTIARNLACNHLQAGYRQHETVLVDMPEIPCQQPGPGKTLQRAEQHAVLQAALRRLPMADRSVLALVYVRELDLADVSRIEGDSVAAIKTRLHRAKRRLRELLPADIRNTETEARYE